MSKLTGKKKKITCVFVCVYQTCEYKFRFMNVVPKNCMPCCFVNVLEFIVLVDINNNKSTSPVENIHQALFISLCMCVLYIHC